MEQVNCEERNLIPAKCKPPSYWVNSSQRSSDPGPVFISPQDPENLPLSQDRLCCIAASRKRKRRQAKPFFFLKKRGKGCRDIEKLAMGQGSGGECSSFLSFQLGFILSSLKRNMRHVCPIQMCTVFVLMLNAVLVCSAKDLLVLRTQPHNRRNGAFTGTAAVI